MRGSLPNCDQQEKGVTNKK